MAWWAIYALGEPQRTVLKVNPQDEPGWCKTSGKSAKKYFALWSVFPTYDDDYCIITVCDGTC